jgi:hypothetical protein
MQSFEAKGGNVNPLLLKLVVARSIAPENFVKDPSSRERRWEEDRIFLDKTTTNVRSKRQERRKK